MRGWRRVVRCKNCGRIYPTDVPELCKKCGEMLHTGANPLLSALFGKESVIFTGNAEKVTAKKSLFGWKVKNDIINQKEGENGSGTGVLAGEKNESEEKS